MAFSLTVRKRAVFSAAMLCWFTSTQLSSTAQASMETLRYNPYGHRTLEEENAHSGLTPYQVRRLQQQEAARLASAQENAAEGVLQAKSEPLKINIPNLNAMQRNAEAREEKIARAAAPIVTTAKAEQIAAPAPAAPPAPVAEAEQVDAPSDATVAEGEQFAALAPAAGPADAKPLIALPEQTVDAAITPAGIPTPAAPADAPLASPISAAENAQEEPATEPPEELRKEAAAAEELIKIANAEDINISKPTALPSLEAPPPALAKRRSANVETAPVRTSATPLVSEPQQSLSKMSRAILTRIPSNLDRQKPGPTTPIDVQRAKDMSTVFKPEETPPAAEGQTVTHEAMGIKIEVRQMKANLDYELEKAYNALSAGNAPLAIEIYKNIINNDANNKGALFGLATTYHRSGQLDAARALYARLLGLDPKNRDALNNFLVLLADEAPEEALVKMEELQKRNPSFSPIPAQMAVIYQRLGNTEQATANMFKAVELAPENLVYRYNLAILLDRQQKYEEAARLYQQLIEAYVRGEVIPGNALKIQQRLTFISSNRQ